MYNFFFYLPHYNYYVELHRMPASPLIYCTAFQVLVVLSELQYYTGSADVKIEVIEPYLILNVGIQHYKIVVIVFQRLSSFDCKRHFH